MLRSPALCLAELASARDRPGLAPLADGAILDGDHDRVPADGGGGALERAADGLPLAGLALTVTA